MSNEMIRNAALDEAAELCLTMDGALNNSGACSVAIRKLKSLAPAPEVQAALDARVELAVKASLSDEVRIICVPHGAGVDKPITEWLADRLAATPQHAAVGAVVQPRYIVIGHGESDHPQAAFVQARDDLLDAVLGMIYTSPADADDDTREHYQDGLADPDEWSDNIWSVEFEIGGITVYCLGEVAALSSASGEPGKCDDCHGSGQIYVGNSGQASDGNAPEFDRCPTCNYRDAPATEVQAEASLGVDDAEANDWKLVPVKFTDRMYDAIYDQFCEWCPEHLRPKLSIAHIRQLLREMQKQLLSAAPDRHLTDALNDLLIQHRVAIEPEHEGQWHADLYGEYGCEPIAHAEGATPLEAARSVIAASSAGDQS